MRNEARDSRARARRRKARERRARAQAARRERRRAREDARRARRREAISRGDNLFNRLSGRTHRAAVQTVSRIRL